MLRDTCSMSANGHRPGHVGEASLYAAYTPALEPVMELALPLSK